MLSRGRSGEPLLVEPHPDKPDKFRIIDGERRWTNSSILVSQGREQYRKIPVEITDRTLTDDERLRVWIYIHRQRREWDAKEKEMVAYRLVDLVGRAGAANILGISVRELDKLVEIFELSEKFTAHEFAHLCQYRTSAYDDLMAGQKTSKRVELHADCMAGYYLGLRKSEHPGASLYRTGLQVWKIGDIQFNSPTHHGTPEERVTTAEFGFRLATLSIASSIRPSRPRRHMQRRSDTGIREPYAGSDRRPVAPLSIHDGILDRKRESSNAAPDGMV